MDDWGLVRTAAIVVAWATVGGGLLMAVLWLAAGGGRAVGPEDEFVTTPEGRAAESARRDRRQATCFSVAQVAGHGLLGLVVAGLVTYAALRSSDRTTGYVAVLVVIAVAASVGLLMFRKWWTGRRPEAPGLEEAEPRGDRPEDRIPLAVAGLHGLAAAGTAALVVVLLLVD